MTQHLDRIKLISCVVRSYHQWYTDMLEKSHADYQRQAIRDALDGKNAKLFKILIGAFKYVGGSDYVAEKVWNEMNPKPTYHGIKHQIKTAKCPKLESFSQFHLCGYKKNDGCKEPQFFKKCPLPRYNMKNGKLNQMVFSVYLFLRDRCESDFIGFVRKKIGSPQQVAGMEEDKLIQMANNLVFELDHIFNVGPKLAYMVMSSLFYSTVGRWNYRRIHPHMVAIDTLVHWFLERTGTLRLFGREHKYGQEQKCHSMEGCVGVINAIADKIDCRRYSSNYPTYYPRMVQACIWKFCTDYCNKKRCKLDEVDDQCEFVEWCKDYSREAIER